jgi:hypothetical protein
MPSGKMMYKEGDTDTTISGRAVMWEDASDTLRAVSVDKPLPINVKNEVVSTVATGAAAIAASLTVPAGKTYQLDAITLALSTAPTTAGDLTVTLNAAVGAAYDALLYTVDPSATAMTSLVWQPNVPTFLEAGDALDVAYANADLRTYGLRIMATEV